MFTRLYATRAGAAGKRQTSKTSRPALTCARSWLVEDAVRSLCVYGSAKQSRTHRQRFWFLTAFFGDTSPACPVHPGRSGKWAAQRMPPAFIVGSYPFFIQTDSESGHRKNLARLENDRLRS